MFFRRKFQPIIFFFVFLFVGPFPSYAQQTLSGMVVADSELATRAVCKGRKAVSITESHGSLGGGGPWRGRRIDGGNETLRHHAASGAHSASDPVCQRRIPVRCRSTFRH